MNDKISDKDLKDWKNFISNKEKLHNKDYKVERKTNIKTRSLDLHGYTLEEANSKISEFIRNSFINNVNKLIIVTGKGLHSQNEKNPYISKDLSILRYSVPDYINKNKELMNMISEISPASISDGGEGAFYILLKKKTKF